MKNCSITNSISIEEEELIIEFGEQLSNTMIIEQYDNKHIIDSETNNTAITEEKLELNIEP